MKPIKQNKGKAIEKIPTSRLVDGKYYYSTKLDGHYVQVAFDGEARVRFWTSGGKEFYLVSMADYIKTNFQGIKFHLECEYNFGCVGKLGDRDLSARITTYRTNFGKGIPTKGDKTLDTFTILDRLDAPDYEFRERLMTIKDIFSDHFWFRVPLQTLVPNLKTAKVMMQQDYLEGYEGGMLKCPHHIYQPGKRTNNIIKLKPRRTADLECIDVTEGEGKYEGMIGALTLKDSFGRIVKAGSGLDDMDRLKPASFFIGKVIEIEYERILDTYIQPTIIRIRDDKSISDID